MSSILRQYTPASTVSKKESNNDSESSLEESACAIVKFTESKHNCTYHKEQRTTTLFYIYGNWYYLWLELSGWMGYVSYGLGADFISPSLPVGNDWYLYLSSKKRPTGRNLGGNRLVRRSGAMSRGTVVLVFFFAHAQFPYNWTYFWEQICALGQLKTTRY